MSMVNESIMLRILRLLDQKYSQSVSGTEILGMIGQNRRDDIQKCLQYLVDKCYVVAVFSARGYVKPDQLLPPEKESYKLTAAGKDFLNVEEEKLAKILKDTGRKPLGFQADNK